MQTTCLSAVCISHYSCVRLGKEIGKFSQQKYFIYTICLLLCTFSFMHACTKSVSKPSAHMQNSAQQFVRKIPINAEWIRLPDEVMLVILLRQILANRLIPTTSSCRRLVMSVEPWSHDCTCNGYQYCYSCSNFQLHNTYIHSQIVMPLHPAVMASSPTLQHFISRCIFGNSFSSKATSNANSHFKTVKTVIHCNDCMQNLKDSSNYNQLSNIC